MCAKKSRGTDLSLVFDAKNKEHTGFKDHEEESHNIWFSVCELNSSNISSQSDPALNFDSTLLRDLNTRKFKKRLMIDDLPVEEKEKM